MNKLVKWLAGPILVVVGLAVMAPQSAEAARWHRYGRCHTYGYSPYYVASPVVRAPRVHVYAPGVRVHVNPWYGSYYWGSGYGHYGYYGW